MPDTLRIGLLGQLQVRDGPGHAVHVGGRQLRVLLALEAGRVVPAGSLAGQIWPEEPPANPSNALQTLVSRLRAELRRASRNQVTVQSRWRELPNMISSQDGTEDRRPRAALRLWRPVCSAPASACAAASPVAAGGSAAVSAAGGGAA
jgi:hypothetical protein